MLPRGLSIESKKVEMSSVSVPTAEMMGLLGLFFLWILGRRYNRGVLGNMCVKYRWVFVGRCPLLTWLIRKFLIVTMDLLKSAIKLLL